MENKGITPLVFLKRKGYAMREWIRFFAILFVCLFSFFAGGFIATLNQELDTLRSFTVVRTDEDASVIVVVSGPNAYQITIPKYPGEMKVCSVLRGKLPLCKR